MKTKNKVSGYIIRSAVVAVLFSLALAIAIFGVLMKSSPNLSAATLSSTIIGFDDLDGSGNQAVPSGYGGLNWENFDVYDAVDDPGIAPSPSGYHDAANGVQSWVSPKNVAFSANVNNGAIPAVSSDTAFNLNSAYLHSVWRNNLQVRVIGSLQGVTKYDNTFHTECDCDHAELHPP